MLRGLKQLLPNVGAGDDVLIGLSQPDDAAVYRLGAGRVLIATVDFFTPIVDDPFDYGRIAAVNSMSDVYAMGGDPFLALSVAAFPDELPPEVIVKILHGAATMLQSAGAVLAGGHTVRDKEPKFGLCVMGFADESALITKGGAQPGELLYLTKPLGTGALSTALKRDRLAPEPLASAVQSMATLSRGPARAARRAGVHGGTDITGFSLAGHALEMAAAASVMLTIDWAQVPVLEGARAAIADGCVPGGTTANETSFAPRVHQLDGMPPLERALLFDPQTSGGLLLAVPPTRCDEFERAIAEEGAVAWRIGRVDAGVGLTILP